MGTDIHFYVQQRNTETLLWEFVDPPDTALSDWDKEFNERYRDDPWHRRTWCSDRNYDLFAMLANVRNGAGFAGVDTGDGFRPIAETRGLPDDFFPTPHMLEHDDPHWGHSHQWLSLREVLDYPAKDLKTKKRGWVTESEFKKWLGLDQPAPTSWCGSVSGPNVLHVDIPTMTSLVQGTLPRESKDASYYCLLEWSTSYFDAARAFFERTVPAALELVDVENADDIRFVMWFDS